MNKIKKNKEPFVSVLTPVFNGEKYIAECIESILAQTYENWEYVIVNNCSTDDTLAIAEKYARMDSRIRIHTNKDHLPIMENLNHAFRQISTESKYCKVVHADDWIFPNCILEMVKVMEQYPTVGVTGSYRLDNNKVNLDGLPYPSHFNRGKDIARQFLLDGTSYFGAPSALMIRSGLIRNREKVYDESYLRADTGACLELLKESDFGFVHQVLTFARRHEMSTTNRVAKQSFAYIYGELKMQLDYGPYYLTGQEHQERFSKKMNLYYILLSRILVQERSVKQFRRLRGMLEDLGLKLRPGMLMKNVFRELFLQPFKMAGFG